MIEEDLKILILGASGFVGTNLLLKISNKKNWIIYAAYNKNPIKIRKNNIIPIKLNLLSREITFDKNLNNIDVIINLAGEVTRKGISSTDELKSLKKTLDINLKIASSIINKNKLQKIIHISSVTGYPSFENRQITNTMFQDDPIKEWFIKGWTYRYIEKIYEYCLREKYISSLKIIRPSMIYGPFEKNENSRLIPELINNKLKNNFENLKFYGDNKNIIFVYDLCDDIIKMINCNERHTVIYCKNNIEISTRLINYICNILIKNNLFQKKIKNELLFKYVTKSIQFEIELEAKKLHNVIIGMRDTIKWFHIMKKKGHHDEHV